MRDPERGLTHEAESRSWQRFGDQVARLTFSVGLERSARLVAVALVPVFLTEVAIDRFLLLYTALIVYVLVTSFAPRNRFLRAADLSVAAALIVATGGQVLPFTFFLMVAVAGPAARGGVRAGVAAGGTLSVVLITTLAFTGLLEDLAATQLLSAGVLLPLVGVTIGAAAQVYADGQARDRRMLQEANQLLSTLRAIADDLPGGLDVTTVAAALVTEVRAVAPETRAVIVYALDHQALRPVAASGLAPGALPTLRVDEVREVVRPGRARLLSRSMLPAGLAEATHDHPWWTITGMRRGDELVGALLVAVDDPETGRQLRPHHVAIATDGALALQNAQLFDGTRERAALAARRHLAGDLHDGVAQALAHLRMELELLSMASPDPDGGELGRLARVARSALEDLRTTIGGLRSPGDDDLAKAIRRHLDFIDTTRGPTIEFEHRGDTHASAVEADEILRVVQEAVSNALRHADAATIRVMLECDEQLLHLAVEDDGAGPQGPTEHPGGGVGIRSMQERAQRLGARLSIRERTGGGTVVELRCPRSPGDEPAPPEQTSAVAAQPRGGSGTGRRS